MRASRQKLNRKFDILLHVAPALTQGDTVFVDRPPLFVAAAHFADSMANATYNKLLSQASEPFHVISVQPRTLTIDKNGISNTDFVDRATRALTIARQHKASGGIEIQMCDLDESISNHSHAMQTYKTNGSAR